MDIEILGIPVILLKLVSSIILLFTNKKGANGPIEGNYIVGNSNDAVSINIQDSYVFIVEKPK